MQIRTRFAPSPTGFLHIGGARTALYSWLFARHHHGAFILRVEDTDVERSTAASVDAILQGMAWLGLNYDEGPFFQSQRFKRYAQAAEQLVEEGKAYYCTCSKERLEALRAEQLAKKQKPRYDGHCRDLNIPETTRPHVIRFRNPHEGEIVFADQVFGNMVFQINELDDLIIIRSDGTPTYNFSVVIDDYDMKITHVIRGDDHINNTPRQINILKALNADIPIYAHLPMILGPDGKRFSKRHGAESVLQYRDEGFLADALLNYLVRLGWSHGDQEIFSRADMIKEFNLDSVQKSPAAYNREKLLWLNQHYIKTENPKLVAEYLAYQFSLLGIDMSNGPDLVEVLKLQAERAKTLKEMAEKSQFFYQEISDYQPEGIKLLTPEILPALKEIYQQLKDLPEWQASTIHQVINAVADQFGLKLGKVAQPIRVAVSGGTSSPPIDTTLSLLTKEKTIARLKKAIAFIEKNPF